MNSEGNFLSLQPYDARWSKARNRQAITPIALHLAYFLDSRSLFFEALQGVFRIGIALSGSLGIPMDSFV